MRHFKKALELMTDREKMRYKDTMIFVFDDPKADIKYDFTYEEIQNETPLCLPSKIISLESIKGPIVSLVPYHTEDEPNWNDKSKHIDIYHALVNEIEPDKYEFFISSKIPGGDRVAVKRITQGEGFVYLTILNTVKTMLDRLYTENIGHAKVNERIKIKSGGEKQIHKIKKIIYVSPRQSECRLPDGQGGDVVWSHRWMVRGHWRKTPTLGKDREGNYCVKGFTWVTEHEKGPENAPLIADKVRLVNKT